MVALQVAEFGQERAGVRIVKIVVFLPKYSDVIQMSLKKFVGKAVFNRSSVKCSIFNKFHWFSNIFQKLYRLN